MSEVVLRVENLSKKFCISLKRSLFYGVIDVFRSILGIPLETGKIREGEFWALKNISFELKKGERLGIIGNNGSGKSTLLRLITGIFSPDTGSIRVKGRVGSLIAVGAGFHPHMTGRENIYLNGSILGMSHKEIELKLDSIIDFAEIGDFIDAPVSTYSSGMRVRLGFSVAVHSEPEVLLVDEILSVGDITFRNKSMKKMSEFKDKTNALIFISHNIEQVRTLCQRVIVIDAGKVVYDGPTHGGIVKYQEISRDKRLFTLNDEKKNKNGIPVKSFEADESEMVSILDIGIMDREYNRIDKLGMDDSLNVFCTFYVKASVEELYFSVTLLNEQDIPCIWVVNNDNSKSNFTNIQPGQYKIVLKILTHNLVPGIYAPSVSIRNGKTGETYERLVLNKYFKVDSDKGCLERGIVSVSENWELLREGYGD